MNYRFSSSISDGTWMAVADLQSAVPLAGGQAAGMAGAPTEEGSPYLLLMRYSTGNCFSPDATTDL